MKKVEGDRILPVERQCFCEWVDHLRKVRGLAAGTVRRYERHVGQALRAIAKPSQEITFRDLERHLAALWSMGRKESTLAGAVAALRSYFEYLVLRGELAASPAAGLRGPRVYQEEAPYLTLGEIEKLLFRGKRRYLPTDPVEARNRVLIAVSYICGLRVSEPGELRVEDLRHEDGKFSILIRRAKAADKDHRREILEPSVALMLGAYLQMREEIAPGSPWLFPSRPRRGRSKLDPSTVHRVFVEAVRRAGIRKRGRTLSFHILRHSLATHLNDREWTGREVQQWLRHKSLTTTQRYIHVRSSKFRSLFKRKSPLAKRSELMPDVTRVGRALLSGL